MHKLSSMEIRVNLPDLRRVDQCHKNLAVRTNSDVLNPLKCKDVTVSDRDFKVYDEWQTTHSVVRETVHCLDKIVCIAVLQWRSDGMVSEEADQEYRKLNQGHLGQIQNEEKVRWA